MSDAQPYHLDEVRSKRQSQSLRDMIAAGDGPLYTAATYALFYWSEELGRPNYAERYEDVESWEFDGVNAARCAELLGFDRTAFATYAAEGQGLWGAAVAKFRELRERHGDLPVMNVFYTGIGEPLRELPDDLAETL